VAAVAAEAREVSRHLNEDSHSLVAGSIGSGGVSAKSLEAAGTSAGGGEISDGGGGGGGATTSLVCCVARDVVVVVVAMVA